MKHYLCDPCRRLVAYNKTKGSGLVVVMLLITTYKNETGLFKHSQQIDQKGDSQGGVAETWGLFYSRFWCPLVILSKSDCFDSCNLLYTTRSHICICKLPSHCSLSPGLNQTVECLHTCMCMALCVLLTFTEWWCRPCLQDYVDSVNSSLDISNVTQKTKVLPYITP